MANKKITKQNPTNNDKSNNVSPISLTEFIDNWGCDSNIPGLVEDMRKRTKASYKEADSWESSLKDFANLLRNIEQYRQEAYNLCNNKKKIIDELIEQTNRYNNEADNEGEQSYLDLFVTKTAEAPSVISNSEYLMFQLAKYINRYAKNIAYLNVLKSRIDKSMEHLKNEYNKSIETNIYKDILIYLETPLTTENSNRCPKRPDIILKHDNNYAVIELKQWTESYINYGLTHPDKQVKGYISALSNHLQETENVNLKKFKIRGYTYLFNQIYDDSIIYDEHQRNQKENQNETPFLFSKHECIDFYDNLMKFLYMQ